MEYVRTLQNNVYTLGVEEGLWVIIKESEKYIEWIFSFNFFFFFENIDVLMAFHSVASWDDRRSKEEVSLSSLTNRFKQH